MKSEAIFARLYELHYRRVLGLCRQMLGSRDSACDAAQEVFTRGYLKFADYDRAQPFEGWIVGMATHHCIDLLRRRSRETQRFGVETEEVMAAVADRTDMLEELLTEERAAQINAAIETLPERYRLPLVLVYYGDCSYDEAAAKLGLTRTHIGALICRARQTLRRTVQNEGERS